MAIKTYTTLEVMDLLFKYHNLEFKSEYGTVKIIKKYGLENVVWDLGNGEISSFEINSNTLQHVWTLVLEPVDFMTALEAFENEGKDISCEIAGTIKKYRKNIFYDKYSPLEDINEMAVSSTEILKGNWFIGNYII